MSLFIVKNASAEAIVDDFQVWGNVTTTGNFGAINPNNPDLKDSDGGWKDKVVSVMRHLSSPKHWFVLV